MPNGLAILIGKAKKEGPEAEASESYGKQAWIDVCSELMDAIKSEDVESFGVALKSAIQMSDMVQEEEED